MRRFLQDADISDIARGLGERVRELRDRAAARRAEAPSSDRKPRASSASHSDYATKTFATRGDLASLPPPPPESSADIDAPSTRKMDSVVPPPPDSDRSRRPPAATSPPRLSIPPETIATRPIETDAGAPSRSPKRGVRVSRAIVALAFASAAALALAVRPGRQSDAVPLSAPHPSVVVSASASAVAERGSPPAVASARPLGPSARVATAPPAIAAPPAASSGASTTGTNTKATVSFVAEPSGTVLVDGRARGSCPLKLSLAAGTHEVRFLFDATGESRGERIRVEAGDSITVRADFTGAMPTVKIQR